MNVLALVTDAFGGFGGIARYNRDFLTALAQCAQGGRVTVLPRSCNDDGSAPPPRVRQLAPKAGKLAYTVAALRVAMSEGPHDLVFCGHLYMAPLGAVIARMLGVPLWLQLHGVEAWNEVSRPQRWAVARASLITAVSRYTRRRFLCYSGVDPARVRVLPNAVAGTFAPGPKPDYLIERHHLRGKKVLLTVGRLAG